MAHRITDLVNPDPARLPSLRSLLRALRAEPRPGVHHFRARDRQRGTIVVRRIMSAPDWEWAHIGADAMVSRYRPL